MKRLGWAGALIVLFSVSSFAQFGGGNPTDDHKDDATVQSGYAIVTPGSSVSNLITVVETFGLKRGDETFQTGQPVGGLTSNVSFYIDISERLDRDLGVAIVNPASAPASVTFALRDRDGFPLGTPKIIIVEGRKQTVDFVSRLFPVPILGAGFGGTGIVQEYTATLTVTSNSPVAITGIRFRGSMFSMINPIRITPSTVDVPRTPNGIGGAGSVLVPQFAADGGWATQLIIGNNTAFPVEVRVDLFKTDGSPLVTKLNHEERSSFQNFTVPANGVIVFSPRDAKGDDRF